jgi:hypothetical protein
VEGGEYIRTQQALTLGGGKVDGGYTWRGLVVKVAGRSGYKYSFSRGRVLLYSSVPEINYGYQISINTSYQIIIVMEV